MYLNESIMLDL